MKKNQKPADAIRPPENPKITYHSGYVDSSIQVFFICTVNDLALEHTKMLEWCKGQLGHYRIDWRAASVITVDEPDFTVLSLHPKGSVHVSCPAGYLEEAIDSTREGPARRGEM